MGDRTPWTQRVDEDLQNFVDRVANSTNLSKSDVIDEALRRLRNNSTVTDDGQFIVNGEIWPDAPESGESTEERLLENQQRIIQLLETPPISERTGVSNKNSDGENVNDQGANLPAANRPSEVEEKMAELAGEYQHDECLDPEEVERVDTRESDVVFHTARYLVPAVTGMINHGIEHRRFADPIEWEEIRDLIQNRLDLSPTTATNYRDKMVDKGVLHPHPSVDGDVVGDDVVESARKHAAAVTDKWSASDIDVSDFSAHERERYPADADAYIADFVREWSRDVYYVTGQTYREDVWCMIQIAVRAFAQIGKPSGKRPNCDPKEMYLAERVAGANQILAQMIKQFGVKRDRLHQVRDLAVDASPDSRLEEWAVKWADVESAVESELFGSEDVDEDDAREVFVEIVGVDPNKSDEGEMRRAYRKWVKENHPDTSDSPDEVDPKVLKRVTEARRALI